jgi:serine/threonine protein kinase
LPEGATFRHHLANGPLPVRKAIEYGAQIARGLAAAQQKGIVHRDLKPENLFATKDGRVKILDFGLAKLVQARARPIGGLLFLFHPFACSRLRPRHRQERQPLGWRRTPDSSPLDLCDCWWSWFLQFESVHNLHHFPFSPPECIARGNSRARQSN